MDFKKSIFFFYPSLLFYTSTTEHVSLLKMQDTAETAAGTEEQSEENVCDCEDWQTDRLRDGDVTLCAC